METVTAERRAINEEIISTMLAQLGGRRFSMMTGSKPQYKDATAKNPLVAFKLIRNQSKATHMKLSYNSAMDLYDMEFVRVHGPNMKTVELKEGLYDNMLQAVFTQVTGLDTRL